VIKPINRALLLRQVKSWREARGARALVTYTPVTYGLESQADRSFYHCVDLLGAFPGIDADLVEREEQRLAKRGVIAIGSSPVVVSHLERMGFESPILMENVADVEVYKNAAVSQRRHGAVFAGNLSQHKLDCRLLNRLVDEGVELILAGPLAEGGGSTDQMKRLVRRQGVNYLGLLNPNELAQLLNASAVGLVPYLVNDYTRGVSPLKVYEYLASGLPVVSTAVPGVYPIDRDVYVETGDSFVEFVRRLSNQSITRVEVDRRVSVAEQHSWTVRGQEFRGLVFGNATHGRAS
jgi:glycosyltransferase involved in cell wall biosynthesis